MSGFLNRRRNGAALLLFLILTILYNSNLRLIAAYDSIPTALLPLSLLMDGSVTLDRFGDWLWKNLPHTRGIVVQREGHYYSFYPVGQSALIAPLLAPAVFLLDVSGWEIPRQVYFARICEKIVAALVAALTAVIMFRALQQLVNGWSAWMLTIVFALGTSTWSIASQALWQHTTGQAFLTGALYFFMQWVRTQQTRSLWWCGVCAGLAILVRPTNVIAVCAFAVPVGLGSRRSKDLAALLAPVIVSTIAMCLLNLYIHGSALGGYGQYAAPSREPVNAMMGVLFSPGRGLFIYSPVLLFALYALVSRRSWAPDIRNLTIACGLFAAGHVAVLSYWRLWWGGYCWGARLATEMVPALIVLIAVIAPALSKQKALLWAFYGLSGLSICIHAIGVYCYPGGAWDSSPVSIDTDPGRVWNWRDNPILRATQAGIEDQPYKNIYKLLRSETWTLKNQMWKAVVPTDIAVAKWWAVPDRSQALEQIGSGQRRAGGACFVDIVVIDGQPGNSARAPSWLNLVGWAFDASSGSVPETVAVELFSPGRQIVVGAGQRQSRSDVALAFRNRSLERAGFAVTANVQGVPPGDYEVRILQVLKDATVGECSPGIRVNFGE